MTEESKRVEQLTAWFHREFANCTHWTNSSQCEAWAYQFARTSGWVSPEEAVAREAAARREAEDDPKHARMYRALLERAEKAEAKVARVEALANAAEKRSPSGIAHDLAHLDEPAAVVIPVRDLRATLAEPERAEEGGR